MIQLRYHTGFLVLWQHLEYIFIQPVLDSHQNQLSDHMVFKCRLPKPKRTFEVNQLLLLLIDLFWQAVVNENQLIFTVHKLEQLLLLLLIVHVAYNLSYVAVREAVVNFNETRSLQLLRLLNVVVVDFGLISYGLHRIV